MPITSYQIKKDHVAFYNEKNSFVKAIQAKDVKSVNIHRMETLTFIEEIDEKIIRII